jgi:hypothetical protein
MMFVSRARLELEALKTSHADHLAECMKLREGIEQNFRMIKGQLDKLLTEKDRRDGAAQIQDESKIVRQHEQLLRVSRFSVYAIVLAAILEPWAEKIYRTIMVHQL